MTKKERDRARVEAADIYVRSILSGNEKTTFLLPNREIAAAVFNELKEIAGSLNVTIKKQGSKWVVVAKGSGKVLGRHGSRSEAEAQLRAIEASKARRKGGKK